jgi:hypothetical protein
MYRPMQLVAQGYRSARLWPLGPAWLSAPAWTLALLEQAVMISASAIITTTNWRDN